MESGDIVKDYVLDKKSGRLVKLGSEGRWDQAAAIGSMAYLMAMLAFFFWQLFDVWIGRYSLAWALGYGDQLAALQDPLFRLVAYAIVGGGLGGTVNGIRSVLNWHVEWQAFGQRYIWKYVTAPWLGATLAVFVFALVRSGIAVVGGDTPPQDSDLRQSLSTLILGILSGYGAREVFIWLDAQVTRLFKVNPPAEREVPDLIGLTREEAETLLAAGDLRLGAVQEEDVEVAEAAGRVIRQMPVPPQMLATGRAVDVTVGRQIPGDGFNG
jgi:hypothetical protein